MNRRRFLQALATGGGVTAAGCVALPFSNDGPPTADVFEDYWYDGTDLVVRFRDGADVRRAVLHNPAADEEYETVTRPGSRVRFPVVFPDRLETYVSRSLRVTAETPDGSTQQRIWGAVHAYVSTVDPLPDGRARLEIENQGDGPLLVRFVAIHGDVPNPTVDPQADSFDPSTFDLGPGVIGIEENRPLSPSRTDLVVPPGETKPFETTYVPFAFPDGVDAADCAGDERTGRIAVVPGSGGSMAYDFTYRLEGEPANLEGRAAACSDPVVDVN
ncbi:twin-arginine translocation signal domain-containing protein [Natrinema gari]|uniref:Twin-arginine translocation signal domain-containing protein n=1 Tax=Natrinema gari JCM 14663 TaxID=1230459 RepID=L9YN33_9EURY|nr:twin-arginine translocation signal domain-containing protein [Natrinema gari]ELY75514.1 hypothetical protein C486_19988 [Natrinema gari JCM 14663]